MRFPSFQLSAAHISAREHYTYSYSTTKGFEVTTQPYSRMISYVRLRLRQIIRI